MATLASFGAIGDGTTDDREAFLNFIAGGGGVIGGGAFRLSSVVTFSNVKDCTFSGYSKELTVLKSDTLIGIKFVGYCCNLVFSDICFTTGFIGINFSVYGTVFFDNASLFNITFIRCRFSAPLSKGNSIKIVQESGKSNGVHFIECEIVDTQRMGIEIQNHKDDGVERCSNIKIVRSLFKNCDYGLSCSGLMSGLNIIKNIFDNMNRIGIEGVGIIDSVIDSNVFQNFVKPYNPLSFTNTRVMRNNVISRNREINPEHKLSVWVIRNSVGMVLKGNVTDGGYFYLTDVHASYITENDIKSKAAYALMIESSSNNLIESNDISNLGAVTNWSTIRCYGARSINNVIKWNRTTQALGGSIFDEINGANSNSTKHNYVGSSCRTESLTSAISSDTDRLRVNDIATDYIIECPSTTIFVELPDQIKWDLTASKITALTMMATTKIVNDKMLVHFKLDQLFTLKQLNRLISVYGVSWRFVWIRSCDGSIENLAIDKSLLITYLIETKTINDDIYLPMYAGLDTVII
jgi:hypothetical protein